MKIESYRDLIVWQKAMTLAKEVTIATRIFPEEEQYALTSQLRRAAVSIPSNIAEGNGRGSTQDYLKYLFISRGSLFETQTQIEIALNLSYLAQTQADSLLALAK